MRILLHRHGIDSRVLEDNYAPVSLRAYLGLFEDAALHLAEPALGLRLGARMRPGGFGPMGLRATQCATIRRGLDSMVRFTSALQSGTQVTLEEDGPHLLLRYMITAPQVGPFRQDQEFTLSGICSLIRKGYNPRWRPVEVHFAHPAPEAPEEVERWFEAPVLFSQPANLLVIGRQEAERIHREEDADMLELIDRHLAGLVEEANRDHSMSDQVRALIALNLGARAITLDTLSALLQMSRRSLQRRLAQEGTTLSALLQGYRQERAEALLREGGTSIEGIAAALGYADGTAFWRAYRGWTGQSPSQGRSPEGSNQEAR
ncbi:AraC family transcriptional regulator [Pseudooceanicola sp. CBS1P-1]|uniref:AraC family transcriptional regulator n=1 Tax=Pseudooceanicola TaxID=1679449 RepID=UPI00136A1113|nr:MULTISPECIES: AraC family transcriptional regulator [Pseudooceanicola]MBT9383368.1 AraC family transcriptional regulator [Pseudooceanicola endophyticus]